MLYFIYREADGTVLGERMFRLHNDHSESKGIGIPPVPRQGELVVVPGEIMEMRVTQIIHDTFGQDWKIYIQLAR